MSAGRGTDLQFQIYGSPYLDKKKNEFNFVSFDNLIKNSDILFVCAPLTAQTQSVFNDKVFNEMKDSSYLINISRAEIIDEASFYNALKNNKIRGAGSDVWFSLEEVNNKRLPSLKFEFHKLNNLLLSPHRAGYVLNESPHLEGVVENLVNYHKTEQLKYQVILENGY